MAFTARAVSTILRTESPAELAQIYSTADVFINPTYEDTYPTVNLEAQACGTPVVTYDVCGTAETIFPGCGETVPCTDVAGLHEKIVSICSRTGSLPDIGSDIEKQSKYQEYMELYEKAVQKSC